ncbi:TPA: sigma-70 family RNA polymerase sigma factor [Clostridioides difficile]|uniref:sigma-70 family RNA polymerase sigma factor n=1 Tax=Clostridioides difficile TaxID=1496 RepID=UPI00016C6845|nr:sigma-70 family RNA polymerase sigma factor [Clostridioides difficile]EGT3944322.1 sigma-70 family RNA polymerase sigma factor [Clostridioides difficile]MBG0197360.1 sigma-70 family RNA polymerase sigma factor [Clostridioides difficile]MCA0574460.1 sigma-70 family RNA polymerase sigma factor [Clostridioides difficile]PBG30600.1 sporulation protein [Clostridioides difficile]SJT16095.1 RNA polymerase sigma-35 factor precursor [Clostridioides difficile]
MPFETKKTLNYSDGAKIEKEFYTKEEKEKVAYANNKLIHHVIKQLNTNVASHDELYSVGLVGYAKALESFDKKRNVKFSTYAINCIRNEILYFLRKENNHNKNTVSFNKILSSDKDGHNLELEDIISEDEISKKRFEDNLVDKEDRETILKALEFLKEEERIVIIYRFGLNNGIMMTQSEIGKMINMSQANISKIQKSSIDKLRLILDKNIYYKQ